MLTRKELADALGVSRQALNQWEREGADVAGALNLPLDEAVQWIKWWREDNKRPTYKEATEPKADGTPQERLLAAQIRKTNAEAEAKELKNAIARGELYDAPEVEQSASLFTSMIRNRMEGWPQKLAMEWPAEFRVLASELLTQEVHLLLQEMSQWKVGE